MVEHCSKQKMENANRKDYEKLLGLLEEYKSKESNNENIKEKLNQITTVLKSNLFGALIDIQEYYTEILQDVSQKPDQALREAEILSKKWETNPPQVNGVTSQVNGLTEEENH